jgi:predicted RNA methylase
MTSLTAGKPIAVDPRHSLVVSTRDERNELVAAECQALSGILPVNGVAMGGRTDRIRRSAYQRFGLSVIAQATEFEALCELVSQSSLDLDGFHISVIACSTWTGDRRETIVAMSDAIQWDPDLTNPRHRLVLIIGEALFTLGSVSSEPLKDYLQHDLKPYRISISLPSRLARGLVNLLPWDVKTVLDPCCGSGSIPLEAIAVGLEVFCGDWKPKMTYMTRANFSHFGYDCAVEQMDARSWNRQVDAVVTDLPQGRYSHVQEGVIQGIVTHAASIATVGVFVAREDMTERLKGSGYMGVEVFRVPKHTSFVRYVHRAWTNRSQSELDGPEF